jgi:hypothetical protein
VLRVFRSDLGLTLAQPVLSNAGWDRGVQPLLNGVRTPSVAGPGLERSERRVETDQSNACRAGGSNGGCAQLDERLRLGYAVAQLPAHAFAYPITCPLTYSIAYGVPDKATGLTHHHGLADQRRDLSNERRDLSNERRQCRGHVASVAASDGCGARR